MVAPRERQEMRQAVAPPLPSPLPPHPLTTGGGEGGGGGCSVQENPSLLLSSGANLHEFKMDLDSA